MTGNALHPGPRVTEVVVEADFDGQRIDNYLFSRLKGVPRARVYRALRSGEVRVNGGRAKPTRRLVVGDNVRLPPLRIAEGPQPQRPGRSLRTLLDDSVLYEDDGLLVLNKPSGVAVHGGSGQSLGVIEALREMRPAARFLELVHRLDRDTSGCLLVAKKRAVLLSLHAQLRGASVDKRYLALLDGRCRRDPFVVDAPLRKNTLRSGERMVSRHEDGKAARTRFEPIRRTDDFSLVWALPETGRTHQIRVHAALAGHPVAGDLKYGQRASESAQRAHGLQRLFLHCSSMTVEYPTGAQLNAVAKLSADLQAVLVGLDLRPPEQLANARPAVFGELAGGGCARPPGRAG